MIIEVYVELKKKKYYKEFEVCAKKIIKKVNIIDYFLIKKRKR
jgi:hypothetical protein